MYLVTAKIAFILAAYLHAITFFAKLLIRFRLQKYNRLAHSIFAHLRFFSFPTPSPCAPPLLPTGSETHQEAC